MIEFFTQEACIEPPISVFTRGVGWTDLDLCYCYVSNQEQAVLNLLEVEVKSSRWQCVLVLLD